jgi:chromate transporter
MLKIGVFTFGGGYAMIALLEREFVENKKWITKDDFLNMAAIAESTPGPIAINSATYIGYKVGKFWGSLLATMGVCIPSFIIIFVISLFLNQFLELQYVEYAFRGIQACVIFLIFSAGIKMLKHIEKDALSIVIMSATFVALILLSLFAVSFSSVFYVLIAGCLGLSFYLINKWAKKSKEKKQITQNLDTATNEENINPQPTHDKDEKQSQPKTTSQKKSNQEKPRKTSKNSPVNKEGKA